MGWYGPRSTADCTCCTHATPCHACASDGQPTETYRVVIPSGDFGAGTYTLSNRLYFADSCQWSVPVSITCGTGTTYSLKMEFKKTGSAFSPVFLASIWWINSMAPGMSGLSPQYQTFQSGLPDCGAFSSLSLSYTSTTFTCGTTLGPALVTAL